MDTLAKMVLQHPKITKHFIQTTLGLKVDHLDIVEGTLSHKGKCENDESEVFYTQVDILARLQDHTQVIIEIQVKKQKAFLQRLLVYWSAQYYHSFEQARQQAKNTHSSYEGVRPVHVISILTKDVLPDKEPFHEFKLRDIRSPVSFVDE